MKRILAKLFFSLTSLFVNAQLLPSIGLNALPANSAAICKPPLYLGSFYTSGLAAGNNAADFKLYDKNGDSLVLSNELLAGKPVVLIGGSLTCPVFRNKINTINQIITTYGTAVKVFVIYTLEAHPLDTSVYFGKVNVTTQNTNAGILFYQPTTYGARKHLADTMNSWVTLNAPVFIDGPCNEWWSTYGPAPNNAYIIMPNGKIAKKHGWFDKAPDRIFCDLDSILSVNSGSCNLAAPNGSFTIKVLNSYAYGNPGDLLYDFVQIKNPTTSPVTILCKKIQKNHPIGWQTAFCADICYSTAEDSIGFTLAANDSLLFSLDYFTDFIADSGSVKVGFRNQTKPNNMYTVRLGANTLGTITGISSIVKKQEIGFYPNPASDFIKLLSPEQNISVQILDGLGNEVFADKYASTINLSEFCNGIYTVRLISENKAFSSLLVISH